jgi:hypothetical protein
MDIQRKAKGIWQKKRYFLCKQCYQASATKQTWSVASTFGASEHFRNKHNLRPSGEEASQEQKETNRSDIEAFLDEQHPLYAERWRTNFINWIID